MQLYVILVLSNVKIEPSNVEKKKIREPPNVTKVRPDVILIWPHVTMELSHV